MRVCCAVILFRGLPAAHPLMRNTHAAPKHLSVQNTRAATKQSFVRQSWRGADHICVNARACAPGPRNGLACTSPCFLLESEYDVGKEELGNKNAQRLHVDLCNGQEDYVTWCDDDTEWVSIHESQPKRFTWHLHVQPQFRCKKTHTHNSGARKHIRTIQVQENTYAQSLSLSLSHTHTHTHTHKHTHTLTHLTVLR